MPLALWQKRRERRGAEHAESLFLKTFAFFASLRALRHFQSLASFDQAGSLKPATEACSSRARSESFPMASAVCRLPEEVSVVVS